MNLGALTTARARELDLLELVKLTVWKFVIEVVTIVKFRIDNGGCNDGGCSEVKIWVPFLGGYSKVHGYDSSKI